MGGTWPFKDDPDVGVFVTHEVLRRGKPILWVHHAHDGDWVFGGAGPFEVETASLVHLSHVVDRHPEIAALADLPRGWRAQRQLPEEAWMREETEEEDE